VAVITAWLVMVAPVVASTEGVWFARILQRLSYSTIANAGSPAANSFCGRCPLAQPFARAFVSRAHHAVVVSPGGGEGM
jgi:precorrin-6x reductase